MRDALLPAAIDNPPSRFIVGRDRERAILRARLSAALCGQGSLALIGGEAGIGKTALADEINREAAARGALVLIGHCDDRTETPPYGPWADVCSHHRLAADRHLLPVAFIRQGAAGADASQAALFQQVVAFLSAVAARQPLVLLLEDIHWADAVSLDLLRVVARTLAPLPILLIATYRTNELTHHHPLYDLLPDLVREAPTARLTLQPLSDEAMHAMVTRRYRLSDADATRLAAYLRRAEGNPFFAGELLQAMEEARLLRPIDHRWELGEIPPLQLPPLLRQVIVGRVARLGEEARRLLTVAAVIGQEMPIDVLAAASSCEMECVLALIERAAEAHIVDEAPDGMHARFAHALVREALYESMTPSRRRVIHRQVGELLAASPDPDPDTVAHHFQCATDARAATWLIKAGERAQRSWAWVAAAARYEAALAMLDPAQNAERARLLYLIAVLRQMVTPWAGIPLLDEAVALAEASGNYLLAICARYYRGVLRCYLWDFRQGLPDVETAAVALDSLSPTQRQRLGEYEILSNELGEQNHWDNLSAWFALLGRYQEARNLAERLIAAEACTQAGYRREGFATYRALGMACAGLGAVDAARVIYRRLCDLQRQNKDYFPLSIVDMDVFERVSLPYRADQITERRVMVAEAENAWRQANRHQQEAMYGSNAAADISRLPRLLLLVLEGQWTEARAFAVQVRAIPGMVPPRRRVAARALGCLARDQGDTRQAWALVAEILPDGCNAAPGETYFLDAQIAQRLASALALDEGDLTTAHAWLAAHDRWLAWSGSIPGRSEGATLWGQYYRAAGDPERAYARAMQALTDAREPHQPLALLAAHRLLGELDTAAGRYADAACHLDAALALADACAAPFERALTLLAIAERCAATDERDEAIALLNEVRAICTPLDAKPTLARADALSARLTPHASGNPAGLTEREVEVLRFLAAGHTNRQIAVLLSLSERTIDTHVRNILTKTCTDNRAAATAFAFHHHLV